MSVNFTGIKNAGAMLMVTPGTASQMRVLSVQLTNDKDGNDLDEFNEAMESTGQPKKFKTAYEGMVSINVASTEPEEEYEIPKHEYYLNGSPLEVNDKNLKAYTYLAKLTRTVAGKENKELGASKEYATSPEFLNGSSIGYFLKRAFIANPNIQIGPMLNAIHNPDNTKARAKEINQAISETMTDYLG